MVKESPLPNPVIKVYINFMSIFFFRIEEDKSRNSSLSVGETVQGWMRDAFDNNATPFFALIICLWGKTIVFIIVENWVGNIVVN